MTDTSSGPSRRDLLTMIGRMGGGVALYQAMTALGHAAETQFKGPPKLSGARPGASVVVLGAGLAGMLAAYELAKAGYKVQLNDAVAVDTGLTWFMYPGGASETDFAELFLKVSGTAGPVNLLGGVAYAPKQEALGRWYFSGASFGTGIPDAPGDKEDNLYIWGDISSSIPNTPVTLKGHLGYSNGNSGLGPNGTSVAPTGKYLDWLVGADVAVGPVVLGVSYIDTDISKSESAYLLPNFSSTKNGSSIASGKVVFSVSAAF